MAITFSGSSASGAFFMRIGRLFQIAKVHNTFRDTIVTEINDLDGEFTAANSDQISPLVSDRDRLAGGNPGLDRLITTVARAIVMETVRDGLGLEPATISDALALIVKDMKRQDVAVEENTISAGTLSAGLDGLTNTSTVGTVLISNNAPEWMTGTSGKKYQNIRAETLRIECTSDQSYGRIAGAEEFTVTGAENPAKTSNDWPAGSGTNRKLTVTAAENQSRSAKSSGGQNMLRNSNFNAWTSATAMSMFTLGGTGTALSSTAGGQGGALSNNTERSTTTFGSRGTYNMQFNGNNSYKHSAFQKLNNVDGSVDTVHSGRSYIVSFAYRAHTTTITSGVLRAALWAGTSSRLSGASTSIDFSSTNATSTWATYSAVFDLSEKVVPQDVRFALDFSTALQADRSLIVGECILAAPVQLYTGGPSVLITRGVNDFRLRDGFTLAYTNNYASEMQTFFDQYLGMNNLVLPVSGTTTIADGTYIA